MIRVQLVRVMLVAMVAIGTRCFAANWEDYGDFRYTLGLPGNGFGVTNEGATGFGGALHIGVPCAYTPTAGNYCGSYSVSSQDSSFRFGFQGANINGTGHLGIGVGNPGKGLYISQTFVEERLSVNCWNVQYQVLSENEQCPALAIGILDVLNERIGRGHAAHGGRSVYAVVSKEIAGGQRPLFGSLGIGTDRFGRGFAGLSWYPWNKVNLGMEYDGFLLRPHLGYEVLGTDAWSVIGTCAWSDFDRPLVGLAVTFGD